MKALDLTQTVPLTEDLSWKDELQKHIQKYLLRPSSTIKNEIKQVKVYEKSANQ